MNRFKLIVTIQGNPAYLSCNQISSVAPTGGVIDDDYFAIDIKMAGGEVYTVRAAGKDAQGAALAVVRHLCP